MQVLNRLVDGYHKDHKAEAELPELPIAGTERRTEERKSRPPPVPTA